MSEKQWKKIRKLFWMGPETRVVTLEDIAYAGLEEERAAARAKGLEEGRQEGRQEGRHEGRQEGRREGRREGLEQGLAAQRALVKELLVARFGKVPKNVTMKLAKADEPTLKRCAKRIITAKRASDVFSTNHSRS